MLIYGRKLGDIKKKCKKLSKTIKKDNNKKTIAIGHYMKLIQRENETKIEFV